MKFCYLDESGMGNEPYVVMAGIIVDAQRMHLTKSAWNEFLADLSSATKRPVQEFHFRDFYRGNGPWRGIDGPRRAEIISTILAWVAKRKHGITFSAIDKNLFGKRKASGEFAGVPTAWCAAAVHCVLGVQKYHQREKKNKGNTVIVFDREVKEEARLSNLVLSPPEWTHSYYDKTAKQVPLDQVVDVPFFVDSRQALLIQVADTISYILRAYAELEAGIAKEIYLGEHDRLKIWAAQIFDRAIPGSMRYPARGGDPAAQAFYSTAPECLRR